MRIEPIESYLNDCQKRETKIRKEMQEKMREEKKRQRLQEKEEKKKEEESKENAVEANEAVKAEDDCQLIQE